MFRGKCCLHLQGRKLKPSVENEYEYKKRAGWGNEIKRTVKESGAVNRAVLRS
jgi:hypothetical protein